MHIRRLMLISIHHHLSARIQRQSKVRGRGLVGIDVDAAKGRIHLDGFIFSVSPFVDMHPASRKAGSQSQAGQQTDRYAHPLPNHGYAPLPCYTPVPVERFRKSPWPGGIPPHS